MSGTASLLPVRTLLIKYVPYRWGYWNDQGRTVHFLGGIAAVLYHCTVPLDTPLAIRVRGGAVWDADESS
jgi:hypothetical protein